MHSLTRRGLLVVGGTGAAGAALAACGTSVETRDSGHDSELLSAALGAEQAVGTAAEAATKAPTESEAEHQLIEAIRDASTARAERLRGLDEQAAAVEDSTAAGGSLADLTKPLDAAIAAYRPAAGELSTAELRSTAIAFLVESAAELAAARGMLGENPAPGPFVTGEAAKPFADTEGETTTSTTGDGSTGSTSTTSSPNTGAG